MNICSNYITFDQTVKTVGSSNENGDVFLKKNISSNRGKHRQSFHSRKNGQRHSGYVISAPKINNESKRSNLYRKSSVLKPLSLVDQLGLAEFKVYPSFHPTCYRRPCHGLCCSCMPYSTRYYGDDPYESPFFGHKFQSAQYFFVSHWCDLVDETTTRKGLYNLLNVPESNPDRSFLTRQCCYVFHCLRIKASFKYPSVRNEVITQDSRVSESVELAATKELEDMKSETSDSLYANLIVKQKTRANKLLVSMKTAISAILIRLTGYILFKVFSHLFDSVTVHRGQLEMIKKATKRNLPVIFLPLHRSHVDYLFVTWILFNCEIPAPFVAAGENLQIPVFGCLLRGLGGFFIKRRLESTKVKKDIVYRAILQAYVTHSLQAGYNLEFFIEGGRTRTGKPCMPKGGLLSVIVDAYMNRTLSDALIVPIAINYEKLLDGNFVTEQLGQSKVPESFWGAVRAIIKVLFTNYGHARVDFAQPFSLKEFVQNNHACFAQSNSSFDQKHRIVTCGSPLHFYNSGIEEGDQNLDLKTAPSSSSLFGSEVTEDYRQLVKKIGEHIVYDAERSQAIMSTNILAWILLYVFRSGAELSSLVKAVDSIKETLQLRSRDVGFSGTAEDTVLHAVCILGSSLVKITYSDNNECSSSIFVQPVLENVIELNYYANSLTPVFVIDAVLVTALVSSLDCDIWNYCDCFIDTSVSLQKIEKSAERLSRILQFEFVFIPCCGNLHQKIQETVDRLVVLEFLTPFEIEQKQSRWSTSDSENSDDELSVGPYYKIKPSSSNLEVIGAYLHMLTALLDAYYAAVFGLRSLLGRQMSDKEFFSHTQDWISSCIEDGTFRFGESIALDPIRNAVKFFESEGIVESYMQDNMRLIYLSQEYNLEEKLVPFIKEINSYRT